VPHLLVHLQPVKDRGPTLQDFHSGQMSKDGAAEMDPAKDAQKFIVNSLGIGTMQHQVSAEKYQKKMTGGDMHMRQGGVAFLLNVINAGGLAQGLFIIGNPPSQPAASFLQV
jgi:hypothetical protein